MDTITRGRRKCVNAEQIKAIVFASKDNMSKTFYFPDTVLASVFGLSHSSFYRELLIMQPAARL